MRDKVRHSAWRIVCAGGYFAAGFNGTIGHNDIWNRIDAPNHYTFVVKDEGAAAQLGLLRDFFASLPFWRMQPFDGVEGEMAVSLAEPGQVYVVYLPHGGEGTVDLSAASRTLTVQWLNPRTGETTDSGAVQGGEKRSFTPPSDGDAVLQIKHVEWGLPHQTGCGGASPTLPGTHAVAVSAGAQASPQVGKYKTLEMVFTPSSAPANPFDTYLLKIEVTDPVGQTFTVEGFYDGDGNAGQTGGSPTRNVALGTPGQVWKVRLCPYLTGTWSWKTVAADAPDSGLAGHSGQFTCVESGDPGGLVAQGRYFKLQDGDYFYPVGHFLDVPGKLPLWSYLGEETTDAQRDAIIARQRNYHDANKFMFYMSNHSDASWDFKEYVTPWVGDHTSSDKKRMDLARWRLYDEYLRQMKDHGLLAYMSIFEDGKRGNYGDLPESDGNRLLRYVMARTSAYSHLWYVLCFEWQEAWTRDEVNLAGTYLQAHNPWRRLISVHDWAFRPWVFADQAWATYIPAQCGNEEKDLGKLNDYVTSLRSHSIRVPKRPDAQRRSAPRGSRLGALPVLADEFGYEETSRRA